MKRKGKNCLKAVLAEKRMANKAKSKILDKDYAVISKY